MHIFSTAIRSFNIEITNRCALKCLECPRNDNDWVSTLPSDLPLSLLEQTFPMEQKGRFKGIRANLCGAYGDCIYHRDFHNIIGYLKKIGMRVLVETNGSYRDQSFWNATCDILGEEDSIIFSVDGLSDTNHLYRVNSRWQDIELAMRTCAPRVPTSWKYIVFRHNEHQIEEAEQRARNMGLNAIIFKKSARFGKDDPLAPRNREFIGIDSRNRRTINQLLEAHTEPSVFDQQVCIRPRCLSGKNVAVTARGYLFPCTSCESADSGTWFMQNKEHFNLRLHSLDDVLASVKWQQLSTMLERASAAPDICVQYCGVHRDFINQHQQYSRGDRKNKPDDSLTRYFD